VPTTCVRVVGENVHRVDLQDVRSYRVRLGRSYIYSEIKMFQVICVSGHLSKTEVFNWITLLATFMARGMPKKDTFTL